jgi:hypothetical protein
MSYIEDLATELALDVLAAQDELDDDNLVQEIAAVIEASSSKMHEAFTTAIRVFGSETRARQLLSARLRTAGKELAPK